MKKYSIIVPTYNEKGNINILVQEIKKAVKDIDYEIIFVDDSNDGTDKVIEKLASKDSNIRLLHRTDKKGLSSAVIDGINMAKSDIISVMDADMQHPPYLLKDMYEEVSNGADFCIPSRFISGGSDGGLNLYRKLVSLVARKLSLFSVFHLRKVTDITSGLFCFRKSNISKKRKLNPIGWKIMLEVLAKSNFKKVVEIPYKFNKRYSGKTKMNKQTVIDYLKQLRILRKEKIINKITVEKRISEEYKNRKLFYLLAFLIPIIIMFGVLCVKGVWLDSEKIAFGDMQAQYIDMLIYIRSVLLGDNNLIYSIIKGVGGSMYSTFAYYMVSPFNLLLPLFKVKDIMKAVYIIILLKIGLSGLTMNMLLNYKNSKNKLINLTLSLCYPLMSFVICSYFCIMWFDVMYMAPLVVMGIDKLVKENNIKFYMICLFITLVFNFYLGYITCVFCIIYFIYLIVNKYTLDDKKEIIKTCIRFVTASIVSGLLAAFIWLPSIIEMFKTARGDVASTTNLPTVLTTFFIGSYGQDTMLFYYQPEIYCSMLVLFMIFAFFTSRRNSNFRKGSTITVFIIFFLSILIKGLSYIWHGFSYPIGYNFRFTFLLCLFSIMVAHKELTSIERVKKPQVLSIFIFLIIIMFFVIFKYNTFGAWLSLGLLLVYLIIMASNLRVKAKSIILFILVIIELSVNAGLLFYKADNRSNFEDYVNDICSNFDYKDTTYRVAGYDYFGTDELIGCNKSSTNGFYSTINANIVNFYNKVGLTGGANVYNDDLNNTPIVDSLLGVKYIYSNKLLNNYKLVDVKVVTKYEPSSGTYYEEKNYIYENPYKLEYGYLINNYKKLSNLDAFKYQNEMFKSISGIPDEENVLKEVVSGRKNINLNKSKYIYVQALSDNNGISINGVEYSPLEKYRIYAFENTWHSDDININYEGYGYNEKAYRIYYLDTDLFESKINYLKSRQAKNIKINKNIITFDINSETDSKLMLSIPYEKEWNIYVDNKKVKYEKLYEMFMGLDVKSGSHKVRMEFKNKTIDYGLIISALALPIFIIMIHEEKRGKNEK